MVLWSYRPTSHRPSTHRQRGTDVAVTGGTRRDIGEEPVAAVLPDEFHGRVEEDVRAVSFCLDGPSVPPAVRIQPRVGVIGRLPHAARQARRF